MSLLTLLLGILNALAPLTGLEGLTAAPAGADLPAREMRVEPLCEHELTAREEERMLAAMVHRCELVGLRGVQVRREGRDFVLRVEGGLMRTMEEYTDTLDELEAVFNERTRLQLLPVHPRSESMVNDARVQDLLIAYETAMVQYEEGKAPGGERPQMPELPPRFSTEGYMLVEYPVISAEDGSSRYEYLVVQRPEFAAEADLLVTEMEVERAAVDVAREGCVDVELTLRGGDVLSRLTRDMEHGSDRLAIMLNGALVSAPVVHATLGCTFVITGLSPHECQSVVDGLAKPLPVPVKVHERQRVGD